MKRRGIIVIVMLLFSAVLFYLAAGLQKSTVDNLISDDKKGSAEVNVSLGPNGEDTNKINEASPEAGPGNTTSAMDIGSTEKKPESTEQKQENNNNNQIKPSTAPAPKPAATMFTLIIADTTSGNRVILKKQISCDGKSNLFDYTTKALDAAGIKKYIKSNGYVAMIDNLFDYPSMPDKTGKDDWASAGWIYYINGKKASVGCKEYIPKPNDIIQWKYWKDAIYEK